MSKDNVTDKEIKVKIHLWTDEETSITYYDDEEMRAEFEEKLDELLNQNNED